MVPNGMCRARMLADTASASASVARTGRHGTETTASTATTTGTVVRGMNTIMQQWRSRCHAPTLAEDAWRCDSRTSPESKHVADCQGGNRNMRKSTFGSQQERVGIKYD